MLGKQLIRHTQILGWCKVLDFIVSTINCSNRVIMKSYEIFHKADEETANAILLWMREEERNVYRSAISSLAQIRKLRPQFVSQQPVVQQFKWLKTQLGLRSAAAVADNLLQIWLIRKYTPMLVQFLNALGIEHNGEGIVDELPQDLDSEKLLVAVDDLFSRFPQGIVSVYLQMFQAQRQGGFAALDSLLQSHPKVNIR